MTTMLTPGEIRSPQNGRVPNLNSPAAPARAGARITVTERDVKKKSDRSLRPTELLRGWWAWTAQPTSFADTWAASAVDRRRIPAENNILRFMWQMSNSTDRLVLFALILTLPTALTGLLRWCAARPTRRYGLYLTLLALTALYLTGRN